MIPDSKPAPESHCLGSTGGGTVCVNHCAHCKEYFNPPGSKPAETPEIKIKGIPKEILEWIGIQSKLGYKSSAYRFIEGAIAMYSKILEDKPKGMRWVNAQERFPLTFGDRFYIKYTDSLERMRKLHSLFKNKFFYDENGFIIGKGDNCKIEWLDESADQDEIASLTSQLTAAREERDIAFKGFDAAKEAIIKQGELLGEFRNVLESLIHDAFECISPDDYKRGKELLKKYPAK